MNSVFTKGYSAFNVLLGIPRFRGDSSSGQLILNRVFDYYSGRFDDMTFSLVNVN